MMAAPCEPLDQNAEETTVVSPSAQLLLQDLRRVSVIRPEAWDGLTDATREELLSQRETAPLLAQLVARELLTEYQAARIGLGKARELILANYRILDHLGRGSMGVVLKAEHLHLGRTVAVKLLSLPGAQAPDALQRFHTEVRAVGRLQHPHIVAALDAGLVPGADSQAPPLAYLVMEFIPGRDLQEHVASHGPLAPERACDIIYQVASALEEAHRHQLVHRDVKPSNIRVTPEGQARLLDFGLVRQFRSGLTEPGTVLGTLDYLAPEQARDAHAVDIRADVYALGGTLFWCLTGRVPFPFQGSVRERLARCQAQAPPSARSLRPEIPPELDAVLARMMATDPDDRYPTPRLVLRALLPFLEPESRVFSSLPARQAASQQPSPEGARVLSRPPRALLVDDEAGPRRLCRLSLEAAGIGCDEAADGVSALGAVWARAYDLVLLDIDMPQMKGTEVLRRLRESPPVPNLKVIMVSGRATGDEMAQMMAAGADDYLAKPFSLVQLVSRVQAALRLKGAQDRSDTLLQHLLGVNHELEQNLHARDSDLVHARNALVLALAELVTYRDTETGAHLMRLQGYGRILAEAAAGLAGFAGEITEDFIHLLECCAPLHDIGKAGLPDYVLLKPGKLAPDERLIMETHTTIGAAVLQKVARQCAFATAFLRMAIDIARHHHERFDGAGYPDRLAGNTIPLAARIVSIGDVYDALRSRRVYKPALPHVDTVRFMTEDSPGHFDPALLKVFQNCAPRFERAFRELAD